MKKLIPFIFLALLLGAVSNSCNNKNDSANEESNDEVSTSSKSSYSALEDSISVAYGDVIGFSLYASLQDSSVNAYGINKENVLETVETALKKDTVNLDRNNQHLFGLGMQLYMTITKLEDVGISTNAKLAFNQIKKAVDGIDDIDFNNTTQAQEKFKNLQDEYQRLMDKALKDIGEKNIVKGKNYIEEQMKNDKDFVKTASGLCYKVIEEGNGTNFNENDVVDVIYVGTHINGKEFDNSKGKIVPFPLQNVVPGFREMITLMKPGSKVKVIIPSELAYGETGAPMGGIGPNETLVFEITTMGVHK